MGQSLCASTLIPENYPPSRRFMRQTMEAELEDQDVRDSKLTYGSRTQPFDIHVMSYNLLADSYATSDMHSHASSAVLSFSFRGPRLIEEISMSGASLICLQEVDRIDDFYDQKLQNLGYNLVYGKREGQGNPLAPEHHTIAIAYKKSEWFMIDNLLIDLGEVSKWLPGDERAMRPKKAMLVYLQHQASHQTLVLGNTHFEHHPDYDYIKFAQAILYMEKVAKYIRDNKGGDRHSSMSSVNDENSLPFISGGDFNALPISSVLSAIYNENIEDGDYVKANEVPSLWQIPATLPKETQNKYKTLNKLFKRKVDMGQMDPIIGHLQSAYQHYDVQAGRIATDETLTRSETMPKFTNYTLGFQGTLDHLFYNNNRLRVVSLLEMPDESQVSREGAIPSTVFSSDHLRIEAVFTLK